MRTLFFGTYDEHMHPRVQVLREGLEDMGHEVSVCNVPLGLSTEDRVRIARQPWRAVPLVVRVAVAWTRLLLRARGQRPEVVVVGYLGHADVHLARRRFPSAIVVLDHMVSLADTVRDRGLEGAGRITRLLAWADRAATARADVVLVDTEENLDLLPPADRPRGLVVPVGAPRAWSSPPPMARPVGNLRVVFFGLFTPLQGAPVIGRALARTAGHSGMEVTMIGTGQDLPATQQAAASASDVRWVPWVPADDLPAVVRQHDVCLGIFGAGDKAGRVVPNKVYQGAAAGCAIVTSDTPCQRRALGDAALYVRAGDATALADALLLLDGDRAGLDRLRRAAHDRAVELWAPAAVVQPLLDALEQRVAP